jgi:hypothetical protein
MAHGTQCANVTTQLAHVTPTIHKVVNNKVCKTSWRFHKKKTTGLGFGLNQLSRHPSPAISIGNKTIALIMKVLWRNATQNNALIPKGTQVTNIRSPVAQRKICGYA